MDAADRPRATGGMPAPRTLLVVFWAVTLLVSGPALVAASPNASAVASDVDTTAAASPALQSATVAQNETNNTTVQHRDPDSVDEQGNLEDVRRWLSQRMVDSLSQSTVQLSQGEYQQAQSALGEQYSDYFGKFVDVAGETEDVDTETARTLNQTRATQREYVQAVAEFRETATAYREAKQAGNETRARRLARQLDAQGERVATLGERLQQQYTAVTNTTGISTANTSQQLATITTNVTSQQRTIVSAELVRTTLAITSQSTTASFTDPLTLSGQIQTASERSDSFSTTQDRIRLAVGNQVLYTAVQADGTFTVEYRPVTIRQGPQDITVEYLPSSDSLYLGSAANTSVRINQVDPSMAVRTTQNTTRFGDSVTVEGRVSVPAVARGISGVPVVLTIGSTQLGRVQTAANGSFQSSVTLPAAVPAGSQSVTARIPLQNRAIAPAQATTSIQVASTATNLSLTPGWQSGILVFSGTLQTAAGQPIAGEVVRLSVNGTTVATVRTNASGGYRATASPTQVHVGDELRVVASYEGHGNLEAAQTVTTTVVPRGAATGGVGGGEGGDGTGPLADLGVSLPVLGGLGALIILVLAGGGYVWWRRGGMASDATDAGTPGAEAASPTPESEPSAAASESTAAEPSLLDAATTALEAGRTEQAVTLAYSAVRQSLTAADGQESPTPGGPQTHWEFYNAHADLDVDEALRELTVLYEQAAFAPTDVDQADAQAALASARTLLER